MKRMFLFCFAFLIFGGVACSPEKKSTDYKFLCEESKNDWKLCNQNRVRYCHIDHFHTGQDCATLNLECVEVGDRGAVCVDKSKTCEGTQASCDNNAATNCVSGNPSVEPCGTAKTCQLKDGTAVCIRKVAACGGKGSLHDGKCECDKGAKLDPDDDQNCIDAE